MGNENSKPETLLKGINAELNRMNLKMTKKMATEEREHVLETLIRYSNVVNSFKGKVKEKDRNATLKKISQTIQDIYDQSSRDSQLDLSAVETNSIIQVPISKKTTLRNTPDLVAKKQKISNGIQVKEQSIPTLKDIEDKFQTLKPQIESALANKDVTQLRVHQQTLKVLATDLEFIDVVDETPLGDKKKKIDSSVTTYYQKIGKAMKEIRRNKDIDYLAKQTKKDKVVEALQELKKELDDLDRSLRVAQRDDNTDALKNIRQNLVKIDQRLSSVETLDENTRNLKLQIVDKRTWLQKYLENATHKSTSDLTKAQSNYEDLIKNIASGENKDKDDIKTKLQSLHSFISTLESEDDDSLKRKKALLNNVTESLVSISGNKPNKPKTNWEPTLVDNFITSWKNLQTSLKTTNANKEELRNLDKLLADIQSSISKTRKLLLTFYDSYTNLKSGLNVSAPNLYTSTSNQKEKFVSSLSVDRLEPIKTKVKIYDLEHDQIRNVREQKARLKQHQQEKRFSEIDHIRTQVQYIKEKYEKSNQKLHLKHKLERYATILEDYVQDNDKLTANNSKILLADVREMLQNISNKKPLVIESVKENINNIQDNILQLEKRIHTFNGNKNDEECQQIREMLTNTQDSLMAVNISSQYNTINVKKRELMNKIKELLESLDMKVNNTFYEEAFLRKACKNLTDLKEKVNRFTGAYKGVLFNQIEKDLNKLLIDTSENVKDKTVAEDIIKDAEKYLQILEHRATKNQSFRHTLTVTAAEDELKMNNLKTDLKIIKKTIDSTPLNAVNSFIELNSRLDLVKLGLDQLKQLHENAEHQKAILENEVETLKNVVDAKIALGQQGFRPWSLEERRKMEEQNKKAAIELDKVEDKLNELRNEIHFFTGTKSDKKFYELDESAIRLTIKMDDIELPKGSDLYDRKVNLLKEVHRFEEILDLRAKETENLIQFESDIKDIENNFEHYINSTKELEILADRVKFLQSTLESSDINDLLVNRKKICIEKMRKMLDKIKHTIHEKNLNEEKLSNLTLALENLRRNIQSNTIIDDNMLQKINNDLSAIRLSLDGLKNLNMLNSQNREELYQEVQTLNELAANKQQMSRENLKRGQEKEKHKADLEKIEHIMKKIKHEIDDFAGSTVDGKYCELEELLNKYMAKVDIMKVNKDNTLSKRKQKLLEELHTYSERLLKRAKDTEEVVRCEQRIKEIERSSRTFNTDNIQQKVQEVKDMLKKIDVDAKLEPRKNTCYRKLEEIAKRAEDSSNLEIALQLAKIEATIGRLKDNIDNFQGIHSDRQYSVITNNLKALSSELESIQFEANSDLGEKRKAFLEVIATYTDILKMKSDDNETSQKLNTRLNVINDRLNKSQDITSIPKEIKEIQAEAERSRMKEKMKNEIHKRCVILLEKYSGKVQKISDAEKEADDVEARIEELGRQVDAFDGDAQSERYKTLDGQLIELNVRMKRSLRDPEHGTRKQRLKERLVGCVTALDARVEQSDGLAEVEGAVAALEAGVGARPLTDAERNALDERLIALQVRLGQLGVGKVLAQRKDGIMRRILGLIRKLKEEGPGGEAVHSDTDDDDGTSV